MSPMAHPKRLAGAGMGRAAAGADVPQGFAACTQELSLQDAIEPGLANALGWCLHKWGGVGKQCPWV